MNKRASFRAVVTADDAGRVLVPVPFDPDVQWGSKNRHHVNGTVDGMRVRAVVEKFAEGHAIVLGPAWRRGCGVAPGDAVDVLLAPEGPQRSAPSRGADEATES
jgi:hypothetical protein